MRSVCNWELTSTSFDNYTMPFALPLESMATNTAMRSFLISTFEICMSRISVTLPAAFSCQFLLQFGPSTYLRLVHAKQWVLRYLCVDHCVSTQIQNFCCSFTFSSPTRFLSTQSSGLLYRNYTSIMNKFVVEFFVVVAIMKIMYKFLDR